MSIDIDAVVAAVLGRDIRVAAKLMRDLDDNRAGALDVLRKLYAHTGRAYTIGVTGSPGAGKSTVVDALITEYRKRGKRVGVIAVDPTSPFSGGAILGDRIRMQRHATDPDVFIRSMATRGHLGGLSRSTAMVASVLDAMGYDFIIVETVGVGQGEVDIVQQAETALVVTVPGLGDEIQALKAGILEIADVLVVNKADREGADRTIRDLIGMLELRGHDAAEVEIMRTVAISSEGVPELVEAIGRHRDRSSAVQLDDAAHSRRYRRTFAELRDILLDRERARVDALLTGNESLVRDVAARKIDPYSALETLAKK